MKNPFETEIKVGVFVATGLGLLMLAILMVGGNNSLFTRQNTYQTHFSSVDGVVVGAKVVLAGLPVGTVSDIVFEEKVGNIRVEFKVPVRYAEWIRTDTEVEILTQGVLGDKYLSLNPGSPEAKPLPPGSEIPNRPSQGIAQVLSKSDKLIASLNSIASSLDRILTNFEAESRQGGLFKHMSTTAKNLSVASSKLHEELDDLQLKKATRNMASILEKINNGTGTLGALVNDPGLYDDAKALMGGANRNRLIRNLVRKTVKEGDEKAAEQSEKN